MERCSSSAWPSMVKRESWPANGMPPLPIAAASMPGSALTRSTSCSENALRCSIVAYRVGANGIGTRSTRSTSNPRSTRCSAMKLRMVRPALTSSTTESITSATTSRLRSAPRSRSRAGAAARFLERAGQVRSRRLQRRHEAEQDAGGNGDAKREEQDRHVDGDARLVRHVRLGHERHNRAGRAVREEHAECAANHGQDDALGEELTEQPAARRADREPHGHLPHPGRGASKLQVRDVRAGDEEQQPHRAQQQPQRGLHLAARHGHLHVVRQHRAEAGSRESRGVLLGEA